MLDSKCHEGRQGKYNATSRRLGVTIIEVEKQ